MLFTEDHDMIQTIAPQRPDGTGEMSVSSPLTTRCIIGLELRNPLGSKSGRFAGGFPVDLAETAQPRRFAFELHNGGAVQYAQLIGFELWKSQRK